MKKIGFGGGCHWCTEAVFQSLEGVETVDQGFVRSDPPHDSWSEAVVVTYSESIMDLESLVEIHLRTHASTSLHKLRGKYRSAVYVFDDGQGKLVRDILNSLQPQFEEQLVTLVLHHRAFRLSDNRFQNYYETDPERPFCRAYIDPKLRMLRERYSDKVRAGI